MYNPPFTITPKILNLVGEITEVITKLEMLSFNIDLKLRKISKIKTITGTLQIEGNTLTEEKVTAILEGKRVLGSLKEITEVKGAIALYENIDKFDYQNLDDLLKAHKILMQDLLKEAGSFRNSNVGVGNLSEIVHIAPPAKQIPKLMQNLFDWLKVDIHPLIKSSVFHYEFEFIHPFVDGNGRIGRFWQTLILYSDAFTEIPTVCFRLSELKHLDFYYNSLQIIPPGIGHLEKLEHLYLSFNQISVLPSDIQNLHHLKSFHAHHNNLEEAPVWFAKLDSLEILDLGFNDIESLPDLSSLKQLKEVDFQENRLHKFPFQLLELPKMRLVFLSYNPFELTTKEQKKLSLLSKEFANKKGKLILFYQ